MVESLVAAFNKISPGMVKKSWSRRSIKLVEAVKKQIAAVDKNTSKWVFSWTEIPLKRKPLTEQLRRLEKDREDVIWN